MRLFLLDFIGSREKKVFPEREIDIFTTYNVNCVRRLSHSSPLYYYYDHCPVVCVSDQFGFI
jgi:hypothetical protein